jgi:hypothetical protein
LTNGLVLLVFQIAIRKLFSKYDCRRLIRTACPSAAAEGALHTKASKSLRSCAPKAVGCMGVFGGSRG